MRIQQNQEETFLLKITDKFRKLHLFLLLLHACSWRWGEINTLLGRIQKPFDIISLLHILKSPFIYFQDSFFQTFQSIYI